MFVEGRVQGVWFRGWTQREATSLGLCGWVRNRRDGRVEATIAGPDDAVDEILRRLHKGPPLARVASVVIEDADVAEAEITDTFETRPTV